MTAHGTPRRLAIWRSICVPRTSSGRNLRYLGFNFQIVVSDERFDVVELGRLSQFASKFASIGSKADDFEAKFVLSDPSRRHGVGGVAKNENPFTRKIG